MENLNIHAWIWLPILLWALLQTEGAAVDGKDVLKRVEQAKSYVGRAKALSLQQGNCQERLSFALDQLSNAEAQVSSEDWGSAKQTLLAAQTANQECIASIQPDSNVPLAEALSFLSSEAGKQVQAAVDQIPDQIAEQSPPADPHNRVSSVTPSPKGTDNGGQNGCPPSEVDGTTCQYSECGKGFGLASCSIGFAQGVGGGKNGQKYVVTHNLDHPSSPTKGSLRYGVNLARESSGIWITFEKDMIIHLEDMLWVQSRTTIDGRGVNVTLNNKNLVISDANDVIIHNIQINNIHGSDTIHIFAGSKRIWIDHVTSFSGSLGLISVLQGATDVTISNCRLQNDNFNMLLGASDADVEDKVMRVTVYRNYFYNSNQRMPHCRWGFCHVVNNLYCDWGYYAIGARAHAKVQADSNVFIGARKKEITPWFEGHDESFDETATIESKNNLLLNGTTFHEFKVSTESLKAPYEEQALSLPILSPTSVEPVVYQCAGALFGAALLKCQHIHPRS